MPQGVFERHLGNVWQAQWLDSVGLACADGQTVSIIRPGRANTDDRGPDFRDAAIVLSGHALTGDVEIHVRTRDWQSHGHHRDAAYDRVALHVVMWHDEGVTTRCSNGREVPVLAVGGRLRAPAAVWWGDGGSFPGGTSQPCQDMAARFGFERAVSLVESAGEARFMSKAGAFRKDLGAGRSRRNALPGRDDGARILPELTPVSGAVTPFAPPSAHVDGRQDEGHPGE